MAIDGTQRGHPAIVRVGNHGFHVLLVGTQAPAINRRAASAVHAASPQHLGEGLLESGPGARFLTEKIGCTGTAFIPARDPKRRWWPALDNAAHHLGQKRVLAGVLTVASEEHDVRNATLTERLPEQFVNVVVGDIAGFGPVEEVDRPLFAGR